jgi:hypothetical protein
LFQKVEELDKRLAAITVICRPLAGSATAGKASNKPEGEEKGEEEQVKAAAAEVEGEGRVVGLKLKWADDSEELLGSMAFRSLLQLIMYRIIKRKFWIWTVYFGVFPAFSDPYHEAK